MEITVAADPVFTIENLRLEAARDDEVLMP